MFDVYGVRGYFDVFDVYEVRGYLMCLMSTDVEGACARRAATSIGLVRGHILFIVNIHICKDESKLNIFRTMKKNHMYVFLCLLQEFAPSRATACVPAGAGPPDSTAPFKFTAAGVVVIVGAVVGAD